MGKHVQLRDEVTMKISRDSTQIFFSRLIIIFAMFMAVAAVVYFTPMPDLKAGNCDRPCDAHDWPMICRVKLEIETPTVLDLNCPSNCSSNCPHDLCPLSALDPILLSNRAFPLPPIHVCQNDVLVVDVINKAPSRSMTLHWRGQHHKEVPFMDGVPLITQCPISSYTTFQYKFRASAPGTHLYHAYSHRDASEGLHGLFIVRQADKLEPHKKLYDIDAKEHVILISSWSNNLLLINGKIALNEDFDVIKVDKNKRYRFRVAYSGGFDDCPVTLSIDKHSLKVITLDGNPIKPHIGDSITLSKGERVDFVLKTNRDVSVDYYFRAESSCGSRGTALIKYINNDDDDDDVKVVVKKELESDPRKFDTMLCKGEIGKVCLGDVKSLEMMPQQLRKSKLDRTFVLGFKSKEVEKRGFTTRIWSLNNLTFTYPSSPLSTQLHDVNINTFCDVENIPKKCAGQEICECVHVEYIPTGESAEIILVDEDGDVDENVFHMHGYNFYVTNARVFETAPKRQFIEELHEKGKLFNNKNIDKAVLKDTVRVPKNGVVAFRFIADNPGFWMLRDEKSKDWTRGMDLVFQVGHYHKMMATPPNFPLCGNFIGPEFFLG